MSHTLMPFSMREFVEIMAEFQNASHYVSDVAVPALIDSLASYKPDGMPWETFLNRLHGEIGIRFSSSGATRIRYRKYINRFKPRILAIIAQRQLEAVAPNDFGL